MPVEVCYTDIPTTITAPRTHTAPVTFSSDIAHTSGKVGFYGVSPTAQRATTSIQKTTNLATSTAFGATQLAVVQEIMNTLAAVGLWAGS